MTENSELMYFLLNGGEAVGKGTQKEMLVSLYPDAVQIREPGGTVEAEIIRAVLLEKDSTLAERMNHLRLLLQEGKTIPLCTDYMQKALRIMERDGLNGMAEAYLYAASRAESNAKVVKPALANNRIILGDRSVACSMAYQGFARELGMDFVWELNQPAIEGTHPHLEIFLHLPLEVSQERLKGRVEKQDRMDLEKESFHQRVREGYLQYYQHYCPYPYEIIDASGTVDEVHEKIRQVIQRYQ